MPLRADWHAQVANFLLERLKFIDESGCHLALMRLFGRAAPGARVAAGVPQNWGENVTLVAAIGVSGVSAPMMVNGAVDGAVFLVYVRQVLCRTLSAGEIVVMDNRGAHRSGGWR